MGEHTVAYMCQFDMRVFFLVYSKNMMITYTAHVHTEYIYTIHLLMITK